MPAYVLHGVSPERRVNEDRAVILRVAKAPATLEQLRDDLACRIGPRLEHVISPRLEHVISRLSRATSDRPQYIQCDAKTRMWSLTDAGKAWAEQLRTAP